MQPISPLTLAQKYEDKDPKKAQQYYHQYFSDHQFDDKAQLAYIRFLTKEKKFVKLQHWVNKVKKQYNQKIEACEISHSPTQGYIEKLFNVLVDFCYQKYNHDPELANIIEKFIEVRKHAQTKKYALPEKFYFKMGNIYEIKQQREMVIQCYEMISPEYFHAPYIKWHLGSLQSESAKSEIWELIGQRSHGVKSQKKREEQDQLFCDYGRLFMEVGNTDRGQADYYFQKAKQRDPLEKQVHHRINKYQQQLKKLLQIRQSQMTQTESINEQSIQIIPKEQMFEIEAKEPRKDDNRVVVLGIKCPEFCLLM